jgi:hypothetical protein
MVMRYDLDQVALDIARKYIPATDPQTLAKLQVDITAALSAQAPSEAVAVHQYRFRNGTSPAWYDEGTGPTPDAWHHDCVQPDHTWRTVYQKKEADHV